MFNRRGIIGLTLIEMMLSLTISLLIIIFLIELYFTSQQSSITQARFKEYQDKYREVSMLLKLEIKQAGYIGCAKLTDDFPLQPYQSLTITPNNQLTGNETQITIRHANSLHATLTSLSNDRLTLTTTKSVKFSKDDILLISDCRHAEIFQAKDVSVNAMQSIIAYQPLQYLFDQTAEVSKFEINTFYVSKTNRIQNNKPVYSFFVRDIKSRDNELVSNIDLIKFSYQLHGVSIDTDSWHTFIALHE